MFNTDTSPLGTGWYDTCAAPVIEYTKGGEELRSAFSAFAAGNFYLVKPDKTWEGACLSHYEKEVAFEDVFDAAKIPIDIVDINKVNFSNSGNNNISLTNVNGRISFISPQTGNYSLSVFSLLGQKLQEFQSDFSTKGTKVDILPTESLSNGSYIFRIDIDQNTYTNKIILNQ